MLEWRRICHQITQPQKTKTQLKQQLGFVFSRNPTGLSTENR